MIGLSIARESGQVRYGHEVIRYAVRTSQARSSDRVSIHVENDGIVLVDAPSHASTQDIKKAVTKRIAWISKHVQAAEKRLALVTPREYVSGETVYYLGRRYRLKIVKKKGLPSVLLQAGYLQVTTHVGTPEHIRELMEEWYLSKASAIFRQRSNEISESLRWVKTNPQLTLRSMRVQWGSCSPCGRITLNPSLIKAPRECIDYVLLHEMCHLKEHNHGKEFYRLLTRHLPDWQRVKKRLDTMADAILAS